MERRKRTMAKRWAAALNGPRRALLTATVAGLGLVGHPAFGGGSGLQVNPGITLAGQQNSSRLSEEILALFADLPARKALKIWAPATPHACAFGVELNGQERLFSASANKALILCERLRQLDSPAVEEQLVARELKLDRHIWSLGSTVFNPPDLSGLVNERTAMEAMIAHSDNTATDMVLESTGGAARVRQFISAIGLTNTMVPDSTRALFGYVFGVPNYKTLTWEQSLALLGRPFVNPPLNDVESLASSADELVSFYAQSLQGRFFRNPQTLQEFRRILSLGDITYMVPFPLGSSVFGKAGYYDSPGPHARCIAGGMYFSNRWVYFAFILNWDAAEVNDPATVTRFFEALRQAITLLQDRLGG